MRIFVTGAHRLHRLRNRWNSSRGYQVLGLGAFGIQAPRPSAAGAAYIAAHAKI